MSDLPKRAFVRSAKLAGLPISMAGRATLGFGRRIGGRPAEMVATEVQQRTAEQVFRVLGELKGGAMKFGQALSVAEAALPEQLVGPYRATLTKLQEAAPAMSPAAVRSVLAGDLGRQWRRNFVSFEEEPAAAASIGQVHRAVWKDGHEVAVKLQYPGAGDALRSDLTQIGRLSKVIAPMMPGLDVRQLADELNERMVEELDYRLEADAQSGFAEAFRGDADIAVPELVRGTEHILVSDWLEGTPLSRVIAEGSPEERDRAGTLLVEFLFSGPARAGLLHADPHPGNFRITPDGRLGVLDFGAVARFPDGLPASLGRLMRQAIDGDSAAMVQGLRDEGFIKPRVQVSAESVHDYLAPFLEPARPDAFTFTRSWLRGQFTRISDPRSPGYTLALKLNLPPEYLLLHRVWLGGLGILAQLESSVAVGAALETWLPGFAPEDHAPDDALDEPEGA